MTRPFQSLVNLLQTAINHNSKMSSSPLLGISKQNFLWKDEKAAPALVICWLTQSPALGLKAICWVPPPLPVHLSSSSPTTRTRLPWLGRAGELQCYIAFGSLSSIRAFKGPPGRFIALWCHDPTFHPMIMYNLPDKPPSHFPPSPVTTAHDALSG